MAKNNNLLESVRYPLHHIVTQYIFFVYGKNNLLYGKFNQFMVPST